MDKLKSILSGKRKMIIDEWVRRLRLEVPAYAPRPVQELRKTITRITDANFAAILEHDFSGIDTFIESISDIRVRLGFSLSEVQAAFDLYRPVLMPLLGHALERDELLEALDRINLCLSYTTIRFSDYFQALHEREIRQYAQNLEERVEVRTRELAESEAKYRKLVEEIQDGYFVNQRGRIVFANPAFCEMHGYALDELIGKPYIVLVAPESRERVTKIYQRRMARGRSEEQYVYLRLHRDGRVLPTENRVTTAPFEGRKAAMGICRDITERVETEKRIREAERMAHIGHLTTSLAHEIRNPLSAAKMSIRMLVKRAGIAPEDERRLQILAQEIDRLNRIVTEMLDFARPMGFEFGPASMGGLVEECLEIIDARVEEKEIEVTRRFGKNIPDMDMDRDKMEQAVINLLLNATDAVAQGGKIEVAVRFRPSDHLLKLEISDDGPGVNGEDAPYLFDPFFSKKAKGTGLGLATAKKIIEGHGGSIRVSPRNPRGARFTVLLPFKRPQTAREEPQNKEVFLT